MWKHHLGYYADEVSESMSEERENGLRERYNRINSGGSWVAGNSPCTVIDRGGKIIIWCLPELFSQTRQVCSIHAFPAIL